MNNINIAQECDEKIAAIGGDMGKVIHRYKRLKRKSRRRKKYPRSKYLQIGNGLKHREFMQYLKNKYRGGNGLKKETFRHVGLKSFVSKADKDRLLAPTTVSVRNN